METERNLIDAKRADIARPSREGENNISQILGRGISRAEYESECERGGATAWTDDQVWRERGGMVDWWLSTPVPHWLTWALARQRYNSLRTEQLVAVIAQPATATCSRCGRQVSTGVLMTSARGSVCPDCYDRT